MPGSMGSQSFYTADVLERWQHLIKIQNVRDKHQEVRWNDRYQCVLRPSDEDGRFNEVFEANLQHLVDMGDVFKTWTATGGKGMGTKGSKLGKIK